MRATLTLKQEAFALAYAETGNASEAYRRSYNASRMKDKQIWEEASKLLKTPKVAQRVKELSDRAREVREKKFEITIESITGMLIEDRALAREAMQAGAAVSASKTIAQLHGLMVEKSENTNFNYELGMLLEEVDGDAGRLPSESLH